MSSPRCPECGGEMVVEQIVGGLWLCLMAGCGHMWRPDLAEPEPDEPAPDAQRRAYRDGEGVR